MSEPVHISQPISQTLEALAKRSQKMQEVLQEAVERGKKEGQIVKKVAVVVRKPDAGS